MTCQFCNSPESIEGKGTFNCGSYRREYCGFRSAECQLGEKILKLTKERDDWKNMACEMFKALRMCMTCLKAPPGSAGFVANTTTRDMKHWREIVADAMEMFPGVEIDRELYHSLDLPKRQREAFCKSRGGEMTPTSLLNDLEDICKRLKYGCGNGRCRINPPKGQHTNMICQCMPSAFSKRLLTLAIEAEEQGWEWEKGMQ